MGASKGLTALGYGIEASVNLGIGGSAGFEVLLIPQPPEGEQSNTRAWLTATIGKGWGADGIRLGVSFWPKKVPITGRITCWDIDIMYSKEPGDELRPAFSFKLSFIRMGVPTPSGDEAQATDIGDVDIADILKFDAIRVGLGFGAAGEIPITLPRQPNNKITIRAPGGEISRSALGHQWANPRDGHNLSLVMTNAEPDIVNPSSIIAGQASELIATIGNNSKGIITVNDGAQLTLNLPNFLASGMVATVPDIEGFTSDPSTASRLVLTYAGAAFELNEIVVQISDVEAVTGAPASVGSCRASMTGIEGTTFNSPAANSANVSLTLVVTTVPIEWMVDDFQYFTLCDGVSPNTTYSTAIGMSPLATSIIPLSIPDGSGDPVTAVQNSDGTIWTLGCQFGVVPGASGDVEQLVAVWSNGQQPANSNTNLKSGNPSYPPLPPSTTDTPSVAKFTQSNDTLTITPQWENQQN